MSVLQERDMNTLVRQTRVSFDTRARHNLTNTVNLSQFTYTQIADDKIKLTCKATTGGLTYNPQIVFNNVQIVEPGTEGSLDILHTNNIMPISASDEHQYTCNCLDYRWTFAYYNNVAGNLLGNPPPPYQAQPGSKPRNPSNTPGLCKHLLKLVEQLQAEGVVQ